MLGLTSETLRRALERCKLETPVVARLEGDDGAYLRTQASITQVPPAAAPSVVDTTGAAAKLAHRGAIPAGRSFPTWLPPPAP